MIYLYSFLRSNLQRWQELADEQQTSRTLSTSSSTTDSHQLLSS